MDKTDKYKIIGDGILDIYGDGPLHVSPNKKWLVTDTYLDKGRVRELILFDLITEDRIIFCPLAVRWLLSL